MTQLGPSIKQVEGFESIKVHYKQKLDEHKRKHFDLLDQRITDLEISIYEDQKLIKDYEEKLRCEYDPKERLKFRQNITQLKEDLESKRTECIELIGKMENAPENFAWQVVEQDRDVELRG